MQIVLTWCAGLFALLAAGSMSLLAADHAGFVAHLGMVTEAPSADEIEAFQLELRVRHKGQVVREVDPGGPASKVGLKVGDVILALDRNDIYSFDDVRDFVATSAPGRKVVVQVLRKGSTASEKITVELARRKLTEQETAVEQVSWDFASLAQLEAALERAAAEKKPLLVGISGAET